MGDMDITNSTISLSVLCISYDSWLQILRLWEIKQKEIDWEEKKRSSEHPPKTRVRGLEWGRTRKLLRSLEVWKRIHGMPLQWRWSGWRAIVAALLKDSPFLFASLAEDGKFYERITSWSTIGHRSNCGKDQGTMDSQMKNKSLDLPPDQVYTTDGEAFVYRNQDALGKGHG